MLPPPRYIGIVFLHMFMYFWSNKKVEKNSRLNSFPQPTSPNSEPSDMCGAGPTIPSHWAATARSDLRVPGGRSPGRRRSWWRRSHGCARSWLTYLSIIHSPKTWRMTSPTLFVEIFHSIYIYILIIWYVYIYISPKTSKLALNFWFRFRFPPPF